MRWELASWHLEPAFHDPLRQVPVRCTLFSKQIQILVVEKLIDRHGLTMTTTLKQPADCLVLNGVEHVDRRAAMTLHDNGLMAGQRLPAGVRDSHVAR